MSTVCSSDADALREAMVGELHAREKIRTDEVASAFHAVPRHLFTPGVPWETAYANDTVITKRDEHGIALSSVSAPWPQAVMLEQAEIRRGMRILEIGSGGYNAAPIRPGCSSPTVTGVLTCLLRAARGAPMCG
ncbi:MAG: hypothetical protein ACRDTG_12415 [Pseudonocardiaceae bacterium]